MPFFWFFYIIDEPKLLISSILAAIIAVALMFGLAFLYDIVYPNNTITGNCINDSITNTITTTVNPNSLPNITNNPITNITNNPITNPITIKYDTLYINDSIILLKLKNKY